MTNRSSSTGSHPVREDQFEDDPIIKMRREQLKAQREREEMRQEISTLREERDEALRKLNEARTDDSDASAEGVREEIKAVVRAHASANGDYGAAWSRLYEEYWQRAGIDLSQRASNRDGATKLDAAEDLGVLEELYTVAYDLYA